MRQTVEEVMEAKLESFAKDMVNVQVKKRIKKENRATMRQTVEEVMEAKLETFAKDMINVQMKKLKTL